MQYQITMTKSRPNVTTKPTYKAPRKALATRAVAKPKPVITEQEMIEDARQKLARFHTMFNLSVDPDFFGTGAGIEVRERAVDFHSEFCDSLVILYTALKLSDKNVTLAKESEKSKRKVKTTELEARPNFPSKSTKRRSQICFSDSSSDAD
jgi:hypothetical protein